MVHSINKCNTGKNVRLEIFYFKSRRYLHAKLSRGGQWTINQVCTLSSKQLACAALGRNQPRGQRVERNAQLTFSMTLSYRLGCVPVSFERHNNITKVPIVPPSYPHATCYGIYSKVWIS